jgi:hypothetical protein
MKDTNIISLPPHGLDDIVELHHIFGKEERDCADGKNKTKYRRN